MKLADGVREALADLTAAELAGALASTPPATLEGIRAWDPVAARICRRREQLLALGIDPDDDTWTAWQARRALVVAEDRKRAAR